MAIYSKANQSVKGSGSGPFTGGPFKGILHTTEGPTAAGAIAAFRSSGSWPHFLVDYAGNVWQFVNTNQGARALQNLPGGVQTNLDSAIQIEIVGFASQPNGHPTAQIEALKSLMRWIEQTSGVKPKGPGRAFASGYGQNSLRFSGPQWDSFDGWCGHCHVPENDHWDPGAININNLLPVTEVKPMYDPPLVLEPIAASLEFNGGTYLAASSGAFYAFGAPAIRGPNGQPYFVGRKVAELYPGNSMDPVIPSYVTRTPNGIIVRTTSNEWYGPYTPTP
jgi:hypothetical protein